MDEVIKVKRIGLARVQPDEARADVLAEGAQLLVVVGADRLASGPPSGSLGAERSITGSGVHTAETPSDGAAARERFRARPGRLAGYGEAVLIAVLLFSETTIDKLAGHAIAPEEVRQVSDGDRIVIRNPRPRVDGSVLIIGPTHGGRILTVVLNPDALDSGAWHVRSAWDASTAQANRYHRDR